MRLRFLGAAVSVVFAACGTNEVGNDAGVDAGGTCCARGTPTAGSCGPVTVGGYGLSGACKQASIAPCRHVHSEADSHGCPIWVDDGACDCDAGPSCPASVDDMVLDLSGYVASSMQPPRAPSPNACTLQQIADFAACHSGDASKCAAFAPDASSCAACLVSQSTDASWGPLVLAGATPTWNVGGCVDLALGQVASEPDSCGQKILAAQGCADYACAACTPFSADASTCDGIALQNSCASYASDEQTACAALADGGPPAAASCFPDPSIADPLAQEGDFVTRLAKFFCGPP